MSRYSISTALYILSVIIFGPRTLAADEATELTSNDIISTHNKVQEAPIRKYTDLKVLGFVTPWNGRGKEVSLNEADRGRLDLVSPVTYQVTPSGLAGGHDYDNEYYTQVNKTGARLMPRLIFEHTSWPLHEFDLLANNVKEFVASIVAECDAHGFTGVVMEIWQALGAAGSFSPGRTGGAFALVQDLGTALRDAGLRTALVLPPYGRDIPQMGIISSALRDLAIAYSYFIVMTYDFSTPASEPGPIAPISWVRTIATYLTRTCELGDKVFLGLNFYGVDFVRDGEVPHPGTRHIVGDQVLDLLRTYDPDLIWQDNYKEHFFAYSDQNGRHVVFYPTRHSIANRLKVAKEIGCGGVAIWDLGQGLEHFFEEL